MFHHYIVSLNVISDPLPPTNLQVENITATSNVGSNSVLLKWNSPKGEGLFTEYSIKYRTFDSNGNQLPWIRLPGVQTTEAEITDMIYGQRYTIQVNTQTYGSVESQYPLLINYTIRKYFTELIYSIKKQIIFY